MDDVLARPAGHTERLPHQATACVVRQRGSNAVTNASRCYAFATAHGEELADTTVAVCTWCRLVEMPITSSIFTSPTRSRMWARPHHQATSLRVEQHVSRRKALIWLIYYKSCPCCKVHVQISTRQFHRKVLSRPVCPPLPKPKGMGIQSRTQAACGIKTKNEIIPQPLSNALLCTILETTVCNLKVHYTRIIYNTPQRQDSFQGTLRCQAKWDIR